MAQTKLEQQVRELRDEILSLHDQEPYCLVKTSTLAGVLDWVDEVLDDSRAARERREDLVACDPNLRLMPGGGMRVIDRSGPSIPPPESYVKSRP